MNSKIFLLITLLLGHELVNAQLVETSTFDPLSISDKTFVIDDGPDLDECVFNVGSTGPNSQGWPVSRTNDALEIDVVIDRYVGEVDSDGFLVNPQHLIDRGLISSEAVIRVASKRPALDSRSSAIRPVIYDPSFTAPSDTPVTPQVSRVYLHRGTAKEKVVGDLKGEFSSVQINNREFWYVNEFKVDISDLKFPHYVNDSFGSRLTGPSSNFPNANMVPAKNTLSVTVDELNVNSPYYHWCMAVDWISVSIDAQSPIALIHGTAAQSSTWDVPEDDNFVEHLSDAGIPFYYKIDLEPNGSIDGNAMLLKQELRKAGVFYGVDSLHLVAHSKGGIDSRRYLSSPYYTPAADIEPQVVSLTTLSTPHDGTVLADLTQIYTNLGKASTSNASIESFLSTEVPSRVLAAIGRVPGGDAVRDLQTMEMASFNRNNILPSNVKMYTIGADADLDESNTIEERENTVFEIPLAPDSFEIELAKAAYDLLGREAKYSVSVQFRDVPVRPASTTTRVMVFNYISQISTFQGDPIPNDLVVTVDSAMHHEAETLLFGSRAYALASHSTVKKAEISEKVLSKISTDFPVMSVPTLPPKPRHNP